MTATLLLPYNVPLNSAPSVVVNVTARGPLGVGGRVGCRVAVGGTAVAVGGALVGGSVLAGAHAARLRRRPRIKFRVLEFITSIIFLTIVIARAEALAWFVEALRA